MDNTDFKISELTETRTIANEDWDPTVNAVSYRKAEVSLTSNAADDLGSVGRAVSEQIDQTVKSGDPSHADLP